MSAHHRREHTSELEDRVRTAELLVDRLQARIVRLTQELAEAVGYDRTAVILQRVNEHFAALPDNEVSV